MTTLSEYLKDPCGTLSIPYHKNNALVMPENMLILHDRDFSTDVLKSYYDEPYFRLRHDLGCTPPFSDDRYEIKTADVSHIPAIAKIINASYENIKITEDRLTAMRTSPVFENDLWVMVYDKETGLPIGCGIAELEREAKEGVLEWIQVLPSFRRMGVGSIIVSQLLGRMKPVCDFATVSGKANDIAPERLYRKCGFYGNDIWHILKKSQP